MDWPIFELTYCGSHSFRYNRVQIIASHFANCIANSSCCYCNVVNHEKNAKQFFSQGEFISSTLYFPCYIQMLSTIIKRSIAYTQNYITKSKKCFSILKITFACSKLKASLRLAYLLQSQFQMIIRMLCNTSNIFYFTLQNFIIQNLRIFSMEVFKNTIVLLYFQFDKFSHPWWTTSFGKKNWKNIK